MPTLMFAVPIHAGQDEACRRFAQELMGTRRLAYAASRGRLGVRYEAVWLAPTPVGALVVVHLTAGAPAAALARLANSEQPFDRWFLDQWLALTSCNLALAARRGRLERIFEWKAAERSAARQKVETSDGVDQKETIK